MKELNMMPHELKETQACSIVVNQYAQSFEVKIQINQDLLSKISLFA